VPPYIVFDHSLGDLFVVRTAGLVLGPGSLGSLEYAVAHLHVPLLVVKGHESIFFTTTVI
jgi:carbonic anhydrase